jgi:hypothetical protein
MKPLNFKSLLPHFAAIGIFVLIALVFCKPALEGKVLQQSDIIHWKGMSKDIADYKEINGQAPLWTNSMFSGMPGYQIATNNNNVLPYYANEAFSLFIPKPFRFFILAALGFYFLGFAFGVNPWISIIGALGYAYASYSSIIVAVGHDTKMLSMAYVPALLGAIVMVYKQKYWIGALLTAIFSSVLISHNHYQIVYYFLILAIVLGVALLADAIRKKEISTFFKPTLIAIAAGCIGLFTNAVMLFTTFDYSKATIRGGQSSINIKDTTRQEANKGGLDTAYAFAWSYGIGETMTLMVPNVYGGASQLLGEDAKLIQTLNDKGVPQQLGNQLGNVLASKGNVKDLKTAVSDFETQSNRMMDAIDTAKKEGKDTTRLQSIFKTYNQHAPQSKDFVSPEMQAELEKGFWETAGAVGLTALEASSGGILSSGVKTITSKTLTLGGKVLSGAKVGATYGTLGGGLNAMSQGGGVKDIATGAVIGGALGAGLGAGIPVAGAGLARGSKYLTPLGRKSIADTKVEDLILKRGQELLKVDSTYVKGRKAQGFLDDAGEASRKRVASVDVLQNSVDTDGLIRTKQPGGAVEQYKAMTVDKWDDVVTTNLERLDEKIDIS